MPTIVLTNTEPHTVTAQNAGQVIEIFSNVPSLGHSVEISIESFNPSHAIWKGSNKLDNQRRVYFFSGAPMYYGIGDTITFQQVINNPDMPPIEITIVF